jgi:hypothetical protein
VPKLFSLIFIFLFFQFFASQDSKANNSFDWATFSAQREQAKYISAKLRRLNNKTSDLRDKPLRVIYFHAKDRKPLKNHIERWDGILSDIQEFYRAEMRALGYGEVTITLEKERKWTNPTAINQEAKSEERFLKLCELKV